MGNANGSSSAGADSSGDRKFKDGRRDQNQKRQQGDQLEVDLNEERELEKLMQHFIKTGERDLLTQQKCITSKVGNVSVKFVEQCIETLKPAMFVEKDMEIIVAFEKKSAEEMPSSSQPEEEGTVHVMSKLRRMQ